MTRRRLRPAHPSERLAELYAVPHDHRHWDDHIERVDATIEIARRLAEQVDAHSAADLSCGSGAVLDALADRIPDEHRVYGDLAPGYAVTGPLEETLERLDPVDLYVCTETLEHLDDPDGVLAQIRARAGALVLSTPVDAWDDRNEEHYWAWDRAGVEEMLTAAGWGDVVMYEELRVGGPYVFGTWGVR